MSLHDLTPGESGMPLMHSELMNPFQHSDAYEPHPPSHHSHVSASHATLDEMHHHSHQHLNALPPSLDAHCMPPQMDHVHFTDCDAPLPMPMPTVMHAHTHAHAHIAQTVHAHVAAPTLVQTGTHPVFDIVGKVRMKRVPTRPGLKARILGPKQTVPVWKDIRMRPSGVKPSYAYTSTSGVLPPPVESAVVPRRSASAHHLPMPLPMPMPMAPLPRYEPPPRCFDGVPAPMQQGSVYGQVHGSVYGQVHHHATPTLVQPQELELPPPQWLMDAGYDLNADFTRGPYASVCRDQSAGGSYAPSVNGCVPAVNGFAPYCGPVDGRWTRGSCDAGTLDGLEGLERNAGTAWDAGTVDPNGGTYDGNGGSTYVADDGRGHLTQVTLKSVNHDHNDGWGGGSLASDRYADGDGDVAEAEFRPLYNGSERQVISQVTPPPPPPSPGAPESMMLATGRRAGAGFSAYASQRRSYRGGSRADASLMA